MGVIGLGLFLVDVYFICFCFVVSLLVLVVPFVLLLLLSVAVISGSFVRGLWCNSVDYSFDFIVVLVFVLF